MASLEIGVIWVVVNISPGSQMERRCNPAEIVPLFHNISCRQSCLLFPVLWGDMSIPDVRGNGALHGWEDRLMQVSRL